MSDLLLMRALLFAGECFLASLLLPLAVFAIAALLRRAALRHLAWTTMFGVLAMLPLAALLLPPRLIVDHAAAPVAMAAPVVEVVPAATTVMVVPPPPPPVDLTMEDMVLLLIAVWLLGLAWQVLRLGVGAAGLMRLRRASVSFAMDLETGCDVRLSAGEHGPSTFGVARPIVLLPRSATAWPAARLDAVLRHECAHIARRDTLSQFVARLVCAVFWLNPLLWLAARQMRRDAEIAADDAVLASGMTPSLYAAELVSLAAQSTGLEPGIAMARPPLVDRVHAVLAQNSSRKGVTKMDMVKMGSLGLAATLLLGAARFDLAVAQDAPAPKVERNVENDVTVDAKAKVNAEAAEAAAVKASADAVVARARAKVSAEADPIKREQYRKDAAQASADADKAKAEAERVAARAHLQTTVTLRRANIDKAKASAEAARMKVLADRIGNPALSENERIAATQALAEGALARTADAFAQQAQTLKGSADVGKLELNQLAADAVAVARQEMAQARVDAARRSTRSAESSSENSNSNDSVTTRGLPGISRTGGNRAYMAGRFASGSVQIEAQVDKAVEEAMAAPELRETARVAISAAIRDALAEAGQKIDAAIAAAKAKAGKTLPVAPTAPN